MFFTESPLYGYTGPSLSKGRSNLKTGSTLVVSYTRNIHCYKKCHLNGYTFVGYLSLYVGLLVKRRAGGKKRLLTFFKGVK